MAGAITPVLLCGGSGTRLWPRSRPSAPKPFLPLVGNSTLFIEALGRCSGDLFDPVVVVTGAEQQELVEEQLGDAAVAEVIVEPQPRQTAAAVALAARRLADDTVMLVCPSDHHIGDAAEFSRVAEHAAAVAREGWLVCIGIRATGPETRFGYLRRGDPIDDHSGAFKVASFVEKPEEAAAREFVEAGNCVWNGGIFAFRAGDYLRELQQYRPEIAKRTAEAIAGGESCGRQFRPAPGPFSGIRAESIDYAVMEHSRRVAMVMADMQWSDVGDWRALYEIRDKDEDGNAVRGPAELIDCRRVLVDSDGPKVHVVGLSDVIVVVDGADVLVTSASRTGDVGQVGRSAQ